MHVFNGGGAEIERFIGEQSRHWNEHNADVTPSLAHHVQLQPCRGLHHILQLSNMLLQCHGDVGHGQRGARVGECRGRLRVHARRRARRHVERQQWLAGCACARHMIFCCCRRRGALLPCFITTRRALLGLLCKTSKGSNDWVTRSTLSGEAGLPVSGSISRRILILIPAHLWGQEAPCRRRSHRQTPLHAQRGSVMTSDDE